MADLRPIPKGFVRLPPGKSHCSLSMETRDVARRTWECPGCASPRIGYGPIDVVIQEDWPDDEPSTFVNGSSLGLARRDFIYALGLSAVMSDLILGNVRTEAGVELTDWCTVYGRHPIIGRGTKHAQHRMDGVE
jgi:hypothetical protein